MKNVQKRYLLGALLAVFTLLSACSSGISASKIGFDVALDPNPLTSSQTTMTFNSKAGSTGATIEGYHIEYLDSSGNNLFPGDSVQFSEGSLNVRVPPGIRCPPFPEGQVNECTVNTAGVVFTRGDSASSAPTSFLPVAIINQLSQLVSVGGAVGATANVTFYGTDDAQRSFTTEPYQFAIALSAGN